MTSSPAVPSADDGSSWLRRLGPLILVLGSAGAANLFQIGGLRLSADRVLGVAAVLVFLVLLARRRVWWTGIHSALATFVAVQIGSSVLNARQWPEGLKFATVYAMGFCCFALAAECARGPEGLRRTARAWIWVGAAVAIFGTSAAIAANAMQKGLPGTAGAQILAPGIAHRRVLFAARATFNEWNLYSSFLLIPFSLALWAWRNGNGRRLVYPVAVIACGLVFGVTRAVWLAASCLVGVFWLAKRLNGRQIAALGAIVAVAFAVQAVAVGASPIRTRVIQPLAARYDWNVAGRWLISSATLHSVAKAPVIGHGAGSTNSLEVTLPGGAPLKKVWNGNAILFVLHDSGAIGLAALLWVCAAAGRRGTRAIERAGGREAAGLAPPLLAAAGALCVAFQFTHGLWLMYPYVFLGFLTAATEIPQEGG